MKHHDSLEQANSKLAQSIQKLSDWRVPATPINYAVAYQYVTAKSPALLVAIDTHLQNVGKPGNFILEQFYTEYVLGQSQFRDGIIDDMDEVLTHIQRDCLQSSLATQNLVNGMEQDIAFIESGNPDEIKMAAMRLRKASQALKSQQQKFAEKVLASQQKTNALKSELEEIKKDIYFDAITGMYNRKGLTKHFDAWIEEDPDKAIGALVIDVDHFQQFSDKFGPLIGDVILSKIANKIASYVDDSGVPVRTGNHEFFILMPEVESTVLGEIAEKIRQGVEKIRFISSKSGIRLPQMTISLGMTEFRNKESLDQLISRSKLALSKAHQNGRNQVALV